MSRKSGNRLKAIALYYDKNRPACRWENWQFRQRKGNFPETGISWYEAMGNAKYAGNATEWHLYES